MRSIKLFALILAFVLGFVSCSRDPEVAKRRYLESGNKYFERGKYREARIFYKDAIQKDPRFGPAYYKLGLTVLKLLETQHGSASEAVQAFRRAVELLPVESNDHWDAAVRLSEIYLVGGNNQKEFTDEVEKTIQGLLKRDPNSWDAHRLKGDLEFGRALALVKESKGEEALKTVNIAIAEYEKAESAKPNQLGVLLQLARAYTGKAEAQRGEEFYRKAIAVDKTNRVAPTELYRLLVLQHKFPQAEQVLRDAYQANPTDYNLLVMLAYHHSQLNQRDQMVSVLNQIKGHFKDYPQAYEKVGDFYLQLSDFDTAMREYRDGMAKDSANKLTYQKRIIETFLRQGKKAEAADLNAQILKEVPDDTDARGLAATLLLDKGEINRALTELQAVVARAPDNPVVRFNLGQAYSARGDYELARQSFRKAIELRPDYLAARLGVAQLEIARGEFDAALKDAHDVLAIDRNNLNARLIESAALVGQRKFGESRTLLDAMIKANPSSPDAYYQLGIINLAESKFAEAEANFRKSYQLNPSNTRGLLGAVETQMAQNKPDAAMKLLQDETSKLPDRKDLSLNLANVAVRVGRFDDAIQIFNKVVNSLDKNDRLRGDIYLRLGETQRRKGDYSAAISSLQKSKELQPESVPTLVTLGLVLDTNLGRWTEAKSVYEAVLKLDPKNGVALNNLAFLLAEHGGAGELEEALTKATQAKQLMPNLPEVTDTLGWIYLKKNLPDAALDHFSKLVQSSPDNPTFRYHLGMALQMKGDKPRAIKELQDALKHNPTKAERDKIQEMLNKLTAS